MIIRPNKRRKIRYTNDGGICKIESEKGTDFLDKASGALQLRTKVVDHTLAAAGTSTESGLIPDGALVLGISFRVKEAVTTSGATNTFDIGDGTDADRYGAAIAGAKDTTADGSDATADPTGFATAAGDIVFDGAGAETFTAGVVRISVVYVQAAAPTAEPETV